MALVQYSDLYWLPDGSLASNTAAVVFPQHSNAFAPIFSDAVGTPLANPTSTDGAGFLTFWAEEGKYWVHMDSEAFLIDVGLSEEDADLSTGVASGGEMNIATATSVEIRALVGYVIDNNNLTSAAVASTKVDRPTQIIPLSPASLARSITFWLMDSAGTVIQQGTEPTPTQRRSLLTLGISFFDTGLGQLVEVATQPVILSQPANQFADFMDAVGPLNLNGNVITPTGANLMINKSAGTLFARGTNHFQSGVLTDDPHTSPSPAQVPATFRYLMRTSTLPTPPAVTLVDPTQFDNGGVLMPVGGGVNTSTVQRVFLFGTNISTAQIAIQYGQNTYSSLTQAVQSLGTEIYVPSPFTSLGALIGYIVVIRTATDLSDPTQAVFVRAGKFPTP